MDRGGDELTKDELQCAELLNVVRRVRHVQLMHSPVKMKESDDEKEKKRKKASKVGS